LQQLVEREFIYQRETTRFAGSVEYVFAQALVRDQIYATLVSRQVQAYHTALAQWLAAPERVDEYLPLIAEHYERAGETVNRAKALLEEARIQEGFTRIRAVEAGVVTEKRIEAGSLATPGTPLMTVEDTSGFRLEANVDERLSGKVKVETPVVVVFESPARRVPGTIAEVFPAVDPATRTFLIKVELTAPSLKSGLFGRVLIPEERKEVLLIPQGAVVEKGQLTGVYAVDDRGIMTYRLIKRGRPYGEKVEVLSGLKTGDRIAVNGLEKAVDGGRVKQ
jgi:RND family efflux transporter MFP subunit